MTHDDDRGSLAMAMLAALVASMLAALIVPIVVTQTKSSRFDETRVDSLHAAQTGIDVMLGLIRASDLTDRDGHVFGDPTKLPCYDSSNPLTGIASGTRHTPRYSVSVTYWATNPNRSAVSATAAASPMVCSSGFGTYDPTSHTATPRYAVVTSTGTGDAVDSGSTGRTLTSTYVFQTDDSNIPGGLIRLYPDSSGTRYCMDAGSATPTVDTPVVLQPCSSSIPPLAQQVFAYRSDLSIQLVSSVTTAAPTGLCLDTATPRHAYDVALTLEPCGVANPATCSDVDACSPPDQQWSVNDNGHLEGASSHNDTDGYCIEAPSQQPQVRLVLRGCAGSTDSTQQTWVPSPTAGAGMAGEANHQLVNYREFATCLDVTGQDPNAPYLILYTCKQNPNPDQVRWNQKFTQSDGAGARPTKTSLTTVAGGTTYCLTSPLSSGGFPRMTTDCSAATAASRWTVYTTEDADGHDLPYAKKYTVVDSSGFCLAPADDNGYIGQYNRVVVATCDGSTGQKWNASASLDSSKLTDTQELPSRS